MYAAGNNMTINQILPMMKYLDILLKVVNSVYRMLYVMSLLNSSYLFQFQMNHRQNLKDFLRKIFKLKKNKNKE